MIYHHKLSVYYLFKTEEVLLQSQNNQFKLHVTSWLYPLLSDKEHVEQANSTSSCEENGDNDNSFSHKRVMRKRCKPYKSTNFSHTFSNVIDFIIFICVYVIYKKKLIRLGIQSSVSNVLVSPAHNWGCRNTFVMKSSLSRGLNTLLKKLCSSLKSAVK